MTSFYLSYSVRSRTTYYTAAADHSSIVIELQYHYRQCERLVQTVLLSLFPFVVRGKKQGPLREISTAPHPREESKDGRFSEWIRITLICCLVGWFYWFVFCFGSGQSLQWGYNLEKSPSPMVWNSFKNQMSQKAGYNINGEVGYWGWGHQQWWQNLVNWRGYGLSTLSCWDL